MKGTQVTLVNILTIGYIATYKITVHKYYTANTKFVFHRCTF